MGKREVLSIMLKKLRKEQNLKQKEFAEKMGVSQSNLSKWERCITLPDYDNLCNIADKLEVTTDYLLGRGKEFESIQKLDEFMDRDYTIETGPFWDDLGKGYYARVVEIPAIIVYERAESKARASLNDAKREWGYGAIKDGVDIPEPKLMEV